MASRGMRLRRSRQMPDFDYGDSNGATVSPTNSPSKRGTRNTPHLAKKSKSKVNGADNTEKTRPIVKLEPDETCVLPTDNLVDVKPSHPTKLKKSGASISKRISLRELIAKDFLPLDLLEHATPAMLLALFGHLDADELSRQFVYKCHLMPSKCSASFKSFGNENKARMNLERHLCWHIEELINDSTGRTVGTKTKFTAESLQAKARRLEKSKLTAKKEGECRVVLEKLPIVQKKASSRKRKLVSPTPHLSSRRRRSNGTTASTGNAEVDIELSAGIGELDQEEVGERQVKSRKGGTKQTVIRKIVHTGVDIVNNRVTTVESGEGKTGLFSRVSKLPTAAARSNIFLETQSLITKNSEMIEKIQLQLSLEKQPYKDHCYPLLVKGKVPSDDKSMIAGEGDNRPAPRVYTLENRAEWDNQSSDSGEDDDVIHHDLACHYKVVGTGASLNAGYVLSNKGDKIPVMQLLQIRSAPAVGEEVVIVRSRPTNLVTQSVQSGCIVESESDDEEPVTTTLSRPYPPMPKYQPELGTKLIVPEEEMNFPDDDEDVPDEWDLNNQDHVKRFAIRCMRELKLKKGLGARNCSVSCKICNINFTATATLMYHYRSHAGIKPFVCLLCNSTFTRQHSLNYHMLIHNDATRFKCPDCGRSFRHPSHYKEHRRRHTGEQPYHCPICETKFKTRNSFKRHITVKHPGCDIQIKMSKTEPSSGVPHAPETAPDAAPSTAPDAAPSTADRSATKTAEPPAVAQEETPKTENGPSADSEIPLTVTSFNDSTSVPNRVGMSVPNRVGKAGTTVLQQVGTPVLYQVGKPLLNQVGTSVLQQVGTSALNQIRLSVPNIAASSQLPATATSQPVSLSTITTVPQKKKPMIIQMRDLYSTTTSSNPQFTALKVVNSANNDKPRIVLPPGVIPVRIRPAGDAVNQNMNGMIAVPVYASGSPVNSAPVGQISYQKAGQPIIIQKAVPVPTVANKN